jgi:hypothetical protein
MLGLLHPLSLHRRNPAGRRHDCGLRSSGTRDGKAISCGGGDVLATLIGLCIQLKPPLEDMRAGVEEGLSAYAADNLKAGEAMPEVSGVGSPDWLVAVSHSARVDQKTFSCVGAFEATICQQPD